MPRKKPPVRFQTMLEIDVPKSRMSKHREIVAAILSDLETHRAGVITCMAQRVNSIEIS